MGWRQQAAIAEKAGWPSNLTPPALSSLYDSTTPAPGGVGRTALESMSPYQLDQLSEKAKWLLSMVRMVVDPTQPSSGRYTPAGYEGLSPGTISIHDLGRRPVSETTLHEGLHAFDWMNRRKPSSALGTLPVATRKRLYQQFWLRPATMPSDAFRRHIALGDLGAGENYATAGMQGKENIPPGLLNNYMNFFR